MHPYTGRLQERFLDGQNSRESGIATTHKPILSQFSLGEYFLKGAVSAISRAFDPVHCDYIYTEGLHGVALVIRGSIRSCSP